MRKWEYLRAVIPMSDQHMAAVLQGAGDEGWELVHMQQVAGVASTPGGIIGAEQPQMMFLFVFKRPKLDLEETTVDVGKGQRIGIARR